MPDKRPAVAQFAKLLVSCCQRRHCSGLPPAGTTHLQRQPVHSGREVGTPGRGGAGRAGTSRRLARRQREPERSGDGRGEGGAQEEGGVIPEEQQHVTGM